MAPDKSVDLRRKDEGETIEPELVSGRWREAGPEPAQSGGQLRPRTILLRLALFFSAILFLPAVVLIAAGAALTSTLIGAFIGIPLMLAGAVLIWVLLKVLAFTGSAVFFTSGRGRRR